MTTRGEDGAFPDGRCTSCRRNHPQVWMRCYAVKDADIVLCINCAAQLARKLLEDLCEVIHGGRHG